MAKPRLLKLATILSIFFTVNLALAPTFVLAQEGPAAESSGCKSGENNLDLGECLYLNSETGTTVGGTYTDPATLIDVIVRNIFPFAGVILFFIIIYAGYLLVQKNSKGLEDARQMMQVAIVGLMIMFSAYWIVQIIGLITGTDIGL